MTTLTCSCGAEKLSAYAPWVSYLSTVHTEERCGEFARLEVSTGLFRKDDLRWVALNPRGPMTLTVTWPLKGEGYPVTFVTGEIALGICYVCQAEPVASAVTVLCLKCIEKNAEHYDTLGFGSFED